MLPFQLTCLFAGILGALLSPVYWILCEWMIARIGDQLPDRAAAFSRWNGTRDWAEVVRTYREIYPASRLPGLIRVLRFGMLASFAAVLLSILALIVTRS
jgi:hypothetical protein